MSAGDKAPDTRTSRRADVVFALAMIGASAITIFEARKQPRSPYDPIGAAAIPIWTSYLAIGLSLLLLLRMLVGRSTLGKAKSLFVGLVEQDTLDYRLRPGVAVATFVLTLAYVVAIPLAGFLPSTFAYMLALGWLMCDRTRFSLTLTAVIAAVASVSIDVVFRRWLLVDLP